MNPYEPPQVVLKKIERAGWIEGIIVGIVIPMVLVGLVFFAMHFSHLWYYQLPFRWY